ncbi:3-dehydroquinate dehydratase [compost metagenome]
MSMAGYGVVSRLAGEIFGSALTFGAAHQPSAPGQVAAAELRKVLELLHGSL